MNSELRSVDIVWELALGSEVTALPVLDLL